MLSMLYCLWVSLGFLFCIFGDILLIMDNQILFLVSMIFFLFAYICFSCMRTGIIKTYYYHRLHFFGTVIGLVIIFIVLSFFLAYIVRNFPKVNIYDISMIVAICIYSLIVAISISSNYIALLVNKSWSTLFSFIGVLLFGLSDSLVILNYIKYHSTLLESCAMILYWMSLTILSWSVYQKDKPVPVYELIDE